MSQNLKIIYDGECPFCSQYVTMVRLKDAVGPVELINAREDRAEVKAVQSAGYDLNEGMALIDGDKIYYGSDCVNRLALLSTSSGFLNRFNAAVFSSPRLSQLLYPVLKTGRKITLRLMGRTPISG